MKNIYQISFDDIFVAYFTSIHWKNYHSETPRLADLINWGLDFTTYKQQIVILIILAITKVELAYLMTYYENLQHTRPLYHVKQQAQRIDVIAFDVIFISQWLWIDIC